MNNRPSSSPFISILELISQRKTTYEYMEPIYIGYRYCRRQRVGSLGVLKSAVAANKRDVKTQ
jgi:hypothetical protein